jgi:hypothetical protein
MTIALVGACTAAAPPAMDPSTTPDAPASSATASATPCPSAWSPVAHAAPTGSIPTLPAPVLPTFPIHVGDDYTVRGAIHDFRSRVHGDEFTKRPVAIVGYIVQTNFAEAPRCAVHAPGKADGPNCNPPVPSFAIGDAKDAKDDVIQVMGFAASWAQVYGQIAALAHTPEAKRAEVKRIDELWGVELPNPLPSVGAKVRVTAKYGPIFAMASSGIHVDTARGILTLQHLETLEAAPRVAELKP